MAFATTKPERFGRWTLASAILACAGCGGGGEEAAAPETAAATEAPKSGVPTVKGLGAQAKGRQGEMDAQAGAAAPQPAAPSSDDAMKQAMMKSQAGAPQPATPAGDGTQSQAQAAPGGRRGRMEESEGPPASGPGAAVPGEVRGGAQAAAAPGAAGAGGGYVPGYAQAGQGAAAPGGAFGGQPGAPGAAMAMPGGYGEPGGATGSGTVLLAETAFLENGEALAAPAGQPGGQGFPGAEPGAGGPGGLGGAQAANDFSEPSKAVESFLSAVSAKDGERIGASISRRAPGEAKAAGLKRILTDAVGRKLTPEDVDAMSETFSEYKVLNITPGKTSGSVNVTIGRERKGTGKTTERSSFERRIMRVHRDGTTGWKIVDFGNRIVND